MPCVGGGVCMSGACGCADAAKDYCDGVGCVNLKNDANNCSACGDACGAGLVCVNAACGCKAGDMMCDNQCTAVNTDVDNCGGCGNQCDQGDVCQGGMCKCAAGATDCQNLNLCTTLQNTPTACGDCGTSCQDDETCVGGNCVCRGALFSCNGQCVDLKHDPNNCGACGTTCDTTTQRCNNGACINNFCNNIGLIVCNDGCYTQAQLNSDPLNCGTCGNACDVSEVCVAGICQTYFPTPSCTTCPCASCDASTICCTVGTNFVICLAGNTCPG